MAADELVGANERQNATVATPATAWIWSDKNTYRPGEPLTLRGTLNPNGDTNSYTIVAYRVNNQTGQKFYLPAGTSAPTDIAGGQIGAASAPLPTLNKTVLVGPQGAIIPQTIPIPEEYGMHTLVAEIRTANGLEVVKRAYWKIGVVREVVDLPSEITTDRLLTNDRVWRVQGTVVVRNANLAIEPGTFIVGLPGSIPASVLLVSATGRITALGTRSRPIIMTSSRPIGERARGDWGGLIMLGRAPINDPGGSLPIEGLPEAPDTRFGGTDERHNCGALRYVRVEFAGSQIRPNEESNSFTWGGCGNSTTGEYLQAHYGFDDSFEWFGGNNDAKYLVGTYGADDYLDVQIGYTGRVQHVVAVVNADKGNRCIEADNYERDFAARPLGRWSVYNLTCVGNGDATGFDEPDAAAVYIRRGAAGFYNNGLALNWATRSFSGANADSIQGYGPENLGIDGWIFWNNGGANATNTVAGSVLAAFQPILAARGSRITFENPMLIRPLEFSDPDFRPMPGSPVRRAGYTLPPDDGFFDQWADYVGAFGDVNWTEEWTTFVQEQDLKP
jgi:hypothetical protein